MSSPPDDTAYQGKDERIQNLRQLAKWRATARVLTEALPYILRYDQKTVVVKYGGNAMGEEGVANHFAQDIVLMRQTGIEPVVVHGGGPQIGAMLKRLEIKSTFIDGLRVTDQAAIDVVEMVLTGTINKQIVSAINNAGGKAVGVSGKDGQLIIAKKLLKTRRNPETGKDEAIDLGFVGEPEEVNTEVLQTIVRADMVAVIAPIGVGRTGETYNINADTVAGAVAGALKADRMLLLTDVPGVMDRNGNLIERLTTTEARALIKDGTISGGMIPKVQTCIDAAERGVRAAVILDGRVQHVLLIELFTEHGAGTMIVRG